MSAPGHRSLLTPGQVEPVQNAWLLQQLVLAPKFHQHALVSGAKRGFLFHEVILRLPLWYTSYSEAGVCFSAHSSALPLSHASCFESLCRVPGCKLDQSFQLPPCCILVSD